MLWTRSQQSCSAVLRLSIRIQVFENVGCVWGTFWGFRVCFRSGCNVYGPAKQTRESSTNAPPRPPHPATGYLQFLKIPQHPEKLSFGEAFPAGSVPLPPAFNAPPLRPPVPSEVSLLWWQIRMCRFVYIDACLPACMHAYRHTSAYIHVCMCVYI